MVQFWNHADDPESLAIELLLKVGIEEVVQSELVTHNGHSENITKRWSVILNPLTLLVFELSDLVVDGGHDTWDKLDAKAEETDDVDQTSKGQDRNVLALICHLDHVGDDQFGQDLEDHVTCQLLGCAALRDEAQRVLEELYESLTRVDTLGFLLELFGDRVLSLDSDIKGLALTKVERQPMSESIVVNGAAHFLFGEGAQAQQIKCWRHAADLSSSRQAR